MSSRGRAGKFTKPKRGGGKHFSRSFRSIQPDEDVSGDTWGKPRGPSAIIASSSGEDDYDDSNDNDDDDDEQQKQKFPTDDVTSSREERRAAARARKEVARKAKDDDDNEEGEEEQEKKEEESSHLAPGNPNNEQNAKNRVSVLSRREREEREKAVAKEKYMKLHLAGKTDQAKADLARLAVIRKEREDAARKRQAELEERRSSADAKFEASGRKK